MLFGAQTDQATAERLIAVAADEGVNMLDTANVYAMGRSEEIIGGALRGTRDDWVIATKTRTPGAPGPNKGGLSRKQIMESVEASLRRLNTDYIDILYWHMEDDATPLTEPVHAMEDLVRQGKIRYFGLSNFRAWRIAEVCRLCDDARIDRPAVCSPLYNLANRQVETEVLPACDFYGLGVVSYSPLARSVLTGKYLPGQQPDPDSRVGRSDMRVMMNEWRPETVEIAARIQSYAEARGITTIQFVVAWALNNRLLTGVIAGPLSLDQWHEYRSALEYFFTEEDEEFADSLVPPGSLSSPGHTDPYFPVEGRVPRTAPPREPGWCNSVRDGLRAKSHAA
jgi:aryl-alcohol dehydrogenase-like predicted oxidoreductase